MDKTVLLVMMMAVACVAVVSMQPAASADSDIPPWVKQVAVLWGNGDISDSEFITALQYLVQVGLLVVPETVQETAEPEIEQTTITHSNIHPDAVSGTITRIIDGDTLVFNGDTYRLSIIDTPERGEDGFDEATNAVNGLCPVGSTAYVEDDSLQGQDRYGRYLGVVWCEGNDYSVTVGEYLSDNGHLKKFYTNFCGNTEAATSKWAEASGNWFYHDVCN